MFFDTQTAAPREPWGYSSTQAPGPGCTVCLLHTSPITATMRVVPSPNAAPENGACDSRDWAMLHPHVLERILLSLLTTPEREPSRPVLQAMMSACGVCQHWRSVGTALFFANNSWQGQATIRHPKQLLTLRPSGQPPSGLMRGQVRREHSRRWGLTGRRQRLVLYQGIQSARGQVEVCGKFLMAAEQRRDGVWELYLDRKCRGRPVARLACNSLRTSYTLTAAAAGMKGPGAAAAAGLPGVGAAVASPQVLMSLQYKLHLKAMVLPRRMSVTLHTPQQSCNTSSAQAWAATRTPPVSSSSGGSSSSSSSGSGAPQAPEAAAHLVSRPEAQQQPAAQVLENKQPHWNHVLRVWCLNFNGRVRLSSAKNFQLVSAAGATAHPQPPAAAPAQPAEGGAAAAAEGDGAAAAAAAAAAGDEGAAAQGAAAAAAAERGGCGGIVMQFGKTDSHAFICDWDPSATTALQAFAVAITTFGTKLLA